MQRPVRSGCHALATAALCRSTRRSAVVPRLTWRSAEAHAAVLLCYGWRGGALQKYTPPCCCALAGVALCRSARRRAVVPWLAWWCCQQCSVEAHAAVLLCSGWRGGALQKRTPRGCCALAGVPLCGSARRRAVAIWLALWPLSRAARLLAKAVFLIHRKRGWRGLACARGGLGASQGG
jgi:hypothetical protein